jgi:hypothetical protein
MGIFLANECLPRNALVGNFTGNLRRFNRNFSMVSHHSFAPSDASMKEPKKQGGYGAQLGRSTTC